MICALFDSRGDHWESPVWSYHFLLPSTFRMTAAPLPSPAASPTPSPSNEDPVPQPQSHLVIWARSCSVFLRGFHMLFSLAGVSFPNLPICLNAAFPWSYLVRKKTCSPSFYVNNNSKTLQTQVDSPGPPHASHVFISPDINTLPNLVIISLLSGFYKCLNMNVSIKYIVLSVF